MVQRNIRCLLAITNCTFSIFFIWYCCLLASYQHHTWLYFIPKLYCLDGAAERQLPVGRLPACNDRAPHPAHSQRLPTPGRSSQPVCTSVNWFWDASLHFFLLFLFWYWSIGKSLRLFVEYLSWILKQRLSLFAV